ncbi:MAG: SF1B family DNA helicase RecD2 [Dissulfurimicrobium sp.]|uniref:SF1B family DNA helicase RecD2 n=1 Tax=Dissulfurimicrobium sp. TaxID=2022436 RepID=UPI00404B94E9
MNGPPVRDKEIFLSGRIERVTYASAETGFVVLRVRPKNGSIFTATGHVPDIANKAGLDGADFEFCGQWTVTKYGRQFAFSSCNPIGSELLFFFSKVVKGLGPKLADELIARYGEEELVRILDNTPERLLDVKGIKERRLEIIMRSWRKYKSLRALAEYLGGGKGVVSPNLIIRIYNHFGDKALAVVRDDPYRLTEVRGIGFKTADRIAMGLGIAPHSPSRIRAAAVHLLIHAAESDGHCYLDEDGLVMLMGDALSSGEQRPDDALLRSVLRSMILDGLLVKGPGHEIGLSQYKYMEDWLADFFKERSNESDRMVITDDIVGGFIERFEETTGFKLAVEQKEVIRRIATEPRLVFGVAGYAGTGKTTVCRAILDLLSAHYATREQIVCCAFTGMASARLKKATGYDAFTIHSLLKYQGEGRFEYGPEKPLPYRVVVLDEASMVNLPIFFRLARALRPDTLLILVGDPAQLPPIGAGNVFSDVLETGLVPAVYLTRIYRQSEDSVLALFANEIRQGRIPDDVDGQGWRDFAFCNVERHNIFALKKGRSDAELKAFRDENNDAILERIQELARQYKERLTHPIWDFQVLTPMRVGKLGTEVLNPVLQTILNPKKELHVQVKSAGMTLFDGDKVVHLQNKDMEIMDWENYVRNGRIFNSEGVRRIFNGNVGLVTGIDNEAGRFYVVYPERIVVAYDFDFFGDIIELAYALTVHKAQGSQYRIVVIPLTNSHYIMLNNKWFYTAVTRAEEKVYLVGQPSALRRACKNVQGVRRATWIGLRGH